MKSQRPADVLDCPSAQPDMRDARPFGVIAGSAEEVRVAFLKKDALDGFEWRERFGTTESTHLFRFGAKCDSSRCGHFDGGSCTLGRRVREMLGSVVDAPPPCLLRPSCRWFAEQGGEVCLRCPQVSTMIPMSESRLAAVAAPPVAASDRENYGVEYVNEEAR
jgi:hypothetical protein